MLPTSPLLPLPIILHERILAPELLKLLLCIPLCAFFGVWVGDCGLDSMVSSVLVNSLLTRRGGGESLTLKPLALFEMSSVVPWMLSIGLDMVEMFSFAVPAAVLSWI